ncbi:MAG: hypothetical protein RIC80_20440 [Cyclobacteriaceae bacterium]
MKSILLSAVLAFFALTANATIRIVDQNGNAPSGVYSTFSSAHGDAQAGDTILLTPSTASYGSLTITKEITLLGIGFNPASSSGTTSKVSSLYFQNGSDGTKIIGLEISNVIYLGYTTATSLSNVVIENCLITSYVTHNSTTTLANIFIRQNVFNDPGSASSISLNVTNQSNIIISNNVFARSANNTHASIYANGGILVEHNLFLGTGVSNSYAFRQLSGAEVRNNIFYGRNPTSSQGLTNVQFFNNLAFGGTTTDLSSSSLSGFGTNVTGSNNLTSANPNFNGTITINTSLTNWDFSFDATLSGTPDLSTSSKDGSSELGIFGGSSPFKTSGSVVPVIQTLDLPTTIQQGTNTTADIVVTGN